VRRSIRAFAIIAAGMCMWAKAPSLAAQAVTATVEGRVTGAEAQPIAAARVQATSEEGEGKAALTDASGRYRLTFTRPSSRFVVSAHALGHTGATRVVRAAAQGVATADFSLAVRAAVLDTVSVSASAVRAAEARRTPGTTSSARSANQLRREALQGEDLSDLATRGSGGTRVPGSEGGVSFAGQSPDQTRATLDGASLEGDAVPREAIRGAAAVTNSYDVARGQFTGGQLAVQTQRGENGWGGAVRVSANLPWLRYGDWPGALGTPTAGGSVDAGGGGALVRDRLFAYGALTLRDEHAPSRSLENLAAGDLLRLRADPDSVRRFVAITDALGAGGGRPLGDARHGAVGLLRLDATLSRLHTAVLRFNGQSSRTWSGDPAWARAGSGAESRGTGGGVMGQLTSGGIHLGNTLRLHHAVSSAHSASSQLTPAGTVLVGGSGPEHGQAESLLFGGNPFADTDQQRTVSEISDEVSYVTPDGAHRLRGGVEWRHQDLRTTSWANRLGTFGFASLADLEQSRPASFTRTLNPREGRAVAAYAAGYVGHHWASGAFSVDYGLRAERSWYPHHLAAAPRVAELFGRAPGRVPSDVRVSPRVGASVEVRLPWDRRAGHGTTTIHGGIGEFGGAVRVPSLATALSETGFPGSAMLVCLGDAAPAPDWHAYRGTPDAAPTACTSGTPQFATRLPRATLFGSDYAAPRVRRASLNGAGQLPGQIFWDASVAVLRGSSEPLAFDRNLLPRVAFTLAEEGGRAVYAPAAAIEPALGTPSPAASRRVDAFGTVREVTGDGRSRTTQLTARLGGILPGNRGTWSVAYAWTHSRLLVGPINAPGGAPASTGADPLRPEWADAPYAPRHVVHGSWNLWPGPPGSRAKFQIRGQLASGLPFTPMVGGDVNGDGAANDRAFVWDPAAAPDSTVASGMRTLLDRAPGGVRGCLRRQSGTVAAANSCRGSWWASLDAVAELQFAKLRGTTANRFTVWMVARNLPAGLDQLLHGPGDLRGWGQISFPDPTLLSVRGFDPERRAYRYEVNPRFGSLANPAAPRAPFTLSVQARLVLGRDPAYRNPLAASPNGGGALAPARVRAHLQQHVLNIPAEVLALNGPRGVQLLPAQAARLQEAADSLQPQITAVVDSLVSSLTEQPGSRTGAQRAQLDALTARARAVIHAGAATSRAVLSPVQAARLPRHLRDPDLQFELLPSMEFAVPADPSTY
jgi:hypothetical protein